MKFIISATDLANMSGLLSKYAASKPSDGFGYVQIVAVDGLAKFKTSNIEQTATIAYMVDGVVEGTAVVEAQRFLKVVKSFVGLVTIEANDSSLIIKQGKSKYQLQLAVNAVLSDLKSVSLPGKILDLGDSMSRISYALDGSASNSTSCFWFNDDGIAASNGYVLAESRLNESTGLVACVPPGALKDFKDKITIRHNDRQIDISIGTFYLSSRLVDSKFPPYRKLVPDHKNWVKVDRKELMTVLARITNMVDESQSAKIGIEDGQFFIKVGLSGSGDYMAGDEILKADDISGAFDVESRVNIKFLSSTINAIGGNKVKLYFGSRIDPIVVRNVDRDDLISLIMPMQTL